MLLHFDGIDWKVSALGSKAVLLEPEVTHDHLTYIHRLFNFIDNIEHTLFADVVPAYRSIALFFENSPKTVFDFLEDPSNDLSIQLKPKNVEIEVNYNVGLDWEHVIRTTGCTKNEIIERHSKPLYTVAMIGFIPGFIFLEGLDSKLSVSRLETPRTQVPAGSIGIGGNQTGVYSLESPGGWNIIGNTTHPLFDIQQSPPISIVPGDRIKFIPTQQ